MSLNPLTKTFTSFRDRLKSVAAGIAGREQADDVVHEAFCRLWERHVKVDNETEALKLSITVVKHFAIDVVRRENAHPSESFNDNFDIASDENEGRENSDAVYDAVVRMSEKVLSPKQFEVFRMHDIEGLSYLETAQRAGVTEANARMILSRARKVIRDIYRKQENDYEQ